MPNVALFKQDGTQSGEVTLNEEIFGIEPNENVVYDAIIMQRASLRQGTHAVKNRQLLSAVVVVNHGNKKEQAVHVKVQSVHHNGVGGGACLWTNTSFLQKHKLNKKVRRLAIKSVLSTKVAEGDLIVVETLNFDAPKQKNLQMC